MLRAIGFGGRTITNAYLAASLLAGLVPAIKAGRIMPAEALRQHP